MTKLNRENQNEHHVRSAYLHGCRLLQWSAVQLHIDVESCAMRGMDRAQWCLARNLLVRAKVITTQLELLVPIAQALPQLRQYYEVVIAAECSTDAKRSNVILFDVPDVRPSHSQKLIAAGCALRR